MRSNVIVGTHNGPKTIKIELFYNIINPLDDYTWFIPAHMRFPTMKSWKVPRDHVISIPQKFCRDASTEPFLMKKYFKYPNDRFIQYEDKDFEMLFNLGMLEILPKFYEDFKPERVYRS